MLLGRFEHLGQKNPLNQQSAYCSQDHIVAWWSKLSTTMTSFYDPNNGIFSLHTQRCQLFNLLSFCFQ